MPSTINAQSLLALPTEITDPSPYRVFGLRPGERDATVISQAIDATVARLNAARSTAEPTAWRQAAAWVKRSRGILLDPTKKTRLDGASGLAHAVSQHAGSPNNAHLATASPAAISPTSDGPVEDPLAGLLPTGGAAAASQSADITPVFRAGPVRSPAAPSPPQGDVLNSGPPLASDSGSLAGVAPGERPSTGPAAVEMEPSEMPVPIQVVKKKGGLGRRRRSRGPAVFLTFLTLVGVGGIAALIYVLTQNSVGIVVNLQPVREDASGGRPATAAARPEPAARPERAASRRSPVDPIMGRLGSESDRAPTRDRVDADKLAAADNWLAGLSDSADDSMAAAAPAPDFMPMPSNPADGPADAMTEPATTAEPATASSRPPPGEGTVPAAGENDAAQAAIAAARQAIEQANWEQMQSLAEAAQRAAVTAEQKRHAEQLFQLAELASYYHGGIEKGLDGLGAGESFDVTDQLQIVVVEIGEQKLVFRFSGRNKEYPRRELPLVLAHRIARFAMPAESPTTVAAANAYQAVAPISTPQYRQQAMAALEAMTEEVEGAKPADVAAAIRDVFGE